MVNVVVSQYSSQREDLGAVSDVNTPTHNCAKSCIHAWVSTMASSNTPAHKKLNTQLFDI